MENFWAPWRFSYVQNVDKVQDGCFLCAEKDKGVDDDRDALILWRGEHCFVILNRYPYCGGHLMIVPNEHTGDFPSLSVPIVTALMQTAQAAVRIFYDVLKVDGVNLGVNLGRPAGAGLVDHVHMHAVPRWNGDTNFMTVLDDVRVISVGLAAAWDKLRPAFDQWHLEASG